MNGGQDLGGTHGLGPVMPEPNEPVFHAEWEKRAFALTLAMGAPGGWNIDMSRFARENRPPRRISGDELLPDLARRAEKLMAGARPRRATTRSTPATRCTRRSRSSARSRPATSRRCSIAAGRPSAKPTARRQFAAGDRVRAKNINPLTHTRLPRYVRGHVGVIERVHRLPRFPGQQRAGRGRKSAMALHRALRRPRIVGRRRRSDRRRCRSMPGSPIWNLFNCHSGALRSSEPGIRELWISGSPRFARRPE